MIYGSVCSGIEAATVAWKPLGWKAAFFSEIEKFPRSVLKHHYPDIPLHGDFTTIKAEEYGAIDLLVGGTPCQSFSVAGLRKGIADERGNLALEYLFLAQRKRPKWLVWENVPGVFSSLSHHAPDISPPPPPLDMECDGQEVDTFDDYTAEELHAFNCFLSGLSELGYGYAYRTLDAQYFGVPQRRRRVFVIGYLGDWRPPAAVLFERESVCRDITPRRETRQGIAKSLRGRPNASCREDSDIYIAHSLRGDGFDASEDGTGRGIPLISSALKARDYKGPSSDGDGDGAPLIPCCIPILEISARQGMAIPINTQLGLRGPETSNTLREGIGIGETGDPMFTLQAAHQHAVAYRTNAGGDVMEQDGIAAALNTKPTLPISLSPSTCAGAMAVRRLTPIECERLQDLPDNYTKISEKTADGPRYKAIGNSMAVGCMRWLGKRIEMVEGLMQ